MCHLSLSWRTICLNVLSWYDFYHSISVAYIFFKKTFLLSILIANYATNIYVFQQKIPQACTPKRMLGSKGEVTIVCAGDCEKTFSHDYYTESGSDGCVKIKAWL